MRFLKKVLSVGQGHRFLTVSFLDQVPIEIGVEAVELLQNCDFLLKSQ
jgi:hypothetical protein